MYRLVLLFCAFTLVSSSVQAQSYFREGFVVTHALDTLKGEVKYGVGVKKFEKCTFRFSASEKPVTYRANDIAGYGYYGYKYYEAHEEIIEKKAQAKQLYEVLVKGRVSLFKGSDGGFYASKLGDDFIKLQDDQKIVDKEYGVGMSHTRKYIGILNLMFSDCVSVPLRKALYKVELKEYLLTKLIIQYNDAMKVPYKVFKSELPFVRLRPSIEVGTFFSKVGQSEYTRNGAKPYTYGPDIKAATPVIGVNIQAVMLKNAPNISIGTGFYYAAPTYYLYAESTGQQENERNEGTINFKELRVPVYFQYTFPGRKLRPYLNVKYNTSWIKKGEMRGYQEIDNGQEIFMNTYNELGFHDRTKGFEFGLGAQYPIAKKLALCLELSRRTSDSFAYSFFYTPIDFPYSGVVYYNVLVGLRFL